MHCISKIIQKYKFIMNNTHTSCLKMITFVIFFIYEGI